MLRGCSLKEKGYWNNKRPVIYGEGHRKGRADSRSGPVGPKPGARHMTGLIGEYELQPYVPILLLKVNYIPVLSNKTLLDHFSKPIRVVCSVWSPSGVD